MEIFSSFANWFDWKNYKSYPETQLFESVDNDWEIIVKDLCNDKKDKNGNNVPPVFDSKLCLKEFKKCQKFLLKNKDRQIFIEIQRYVWLYKIDKFLLKNKDRQIFLEFEICMAKCIKIK